ncbi:lytic murein transglycosylase [Pelagibacteraceae bacterium]|nr:lytic murein transglycosylase [Pelagibacteraceae bacterium]
MPTNSEWNSWLIDVRLEAKEKNISDKTINLYLLNVKPQKKIILRDRCQPESTITLKEYLYYRVDKSRIIAGKNVLKEHATLLKKISQHFGIQPRFIVAVLGMESFYGRNQGKIDTITAVTTLAFDRRRSDFYRKQLFAALKILDDGLVPSGQLIGSWGGAVGMTQMIPTTFLESAYDWDGDGIDIWNSYADGFASTANYLTSIDRNPWSIDSTWGREVSPPENIEELYSSLQQKNPKGCGAVKRRSVAKTLLEWSNLGFKTIAKSKLPQRLDLEARLVAPDGVKGRMFLVYPNYKNILYYNCSSYYAISIGLLSDEINN